MYDVSESNKDKAILDLVFSTEPDLVSHVQTLNSSGDSDHSMLTFNIHMKSITKNVSRSVFDYNKADFDSIIVYIGFPMVSRYLMMN